MQVLIPSALQSYTGENGSKRKGATVADGARTTLTGAIPGSVSA
jgi:hypothetical protein